MGLQIRLVVVAVAIAVVILAAWRFLFRPRFQCATCCHCRKLFKDGSLCGYGPEDTFKKVVQIKNCLDYRKVYALDEAPFH